MSSKTEQRLRALEQAAPPCKGFVVATESLSEPGAYFDSNGQRYTSEQLEALAGQGWQVIKVCFVDDWRGGSAGSNTVKLKWGDDEL